MRSGDLTGCQDYASALALGRGAPVDVEAAKTLFQTTCNRGNQAACLSIASMYLEGTFGVTQDLARGVALASDACEHGNANACNAVATTYFDGFQATTKERGALLAAPYLEKACSGGSLRGCANLGQLYAVGLGVAFDQTRAQTLLKKACGGGIRAACDILAKLGSP